MNHAMHIADHPAPVCRVYEAQVENRPEYTVRLAICQGGEERYAEDVTSGRTLFRLGRMLLQTPDRDLALGQAQVRYA